MAKKYLLPETGNFYKANLHCHTTVSDGTKTPEEIKEMYKNAGYSVVAYTDHEVFIPHNDLTDDSFVALNGYELHIPYWKDMTFRFKKSCHVCLVALESDNHTQVCYHRTNYIYGGNMLNYRDKVKFDESLPDYIRTFSSEGISEIMKIGRDNGFFVTYNHPNWSLETYEDYIKYENMHAMEIFNFDSYSIGYPEYNEKEYDDMLRCGKRIFCVATDDNHNKKNDCFGGFTMIKADKLEYKAITDALLKGNFYASMGPEIHSLYFEDGKIHIKSSEAQSICLNTASRRAQRVTGCLTEAVFDVVPEDEYVRITVTDMKGKKANTNAYFTDELFK